MTQTAIAELYHKSVDTINGQIININTEGKLEQNRTVCENRIVQAE